MLRIERPKAPDQQASQPMYRREVLEAACCLSVGLDETKLLKAMESERSTLPTRCGTLACENLSLNARDWRATTFRAYSATVPQRFVRLLDDVAPGILENVMNKTLLSAYESTPIAAFDLCSIGTVSDFKEISRYRLLGTGGFEKVAPRW